MTDPQQPWSRWTAAAVMAQAAQKGWWRRNMWGLLALLPAVAVVVVLRFDDIYWAHWRNLPLVPLNAARQQWLDFDGAKMRLTEFGPADGLVGRGGEPFDLPDGITPWRVVIEFRAPDQESMAGCQIALEDADSRLYGMRPEELDGVRGLPFPTCTAPDDAGSTDYSTTALFVMPDGAEPVAVRISWGSRFPRYARLSVTG